ncbi:MAG: aminoglycoside 6'-N-acetyltransferase [Bacteroidia bacterium]
MKIIEYQAKDFEILYNLSRKLYPNYSDKDLLRDLKMFVTNKTQRIYLATENDNTVGFIMVSIRYDYVEGASSSPTGYLEAIFIEEAYRGKGIAKLLLEKGESWIKSHGCTEMGSDTWLNSQSSIDFHLKLGFEEEDRLVHFIKEI